MRAWRIITTCVVGVALAVAIGCASTKPTVETTGDRPAAETPAPQHDAAAGQAVFDANCGDCHRAGRHDTEGTAPDIMGRTVTARLLARHHGESLTGADAANLRAFLAGR